MSSSLPLGLRCQPSGKESKHKHRPRPLQLELPAKTQTVQVATKSASPGSRCWRLSKRTPYRRRAWALLRTQNPPRRRGWQLCERGCRLWDVRKRSGRMRSRTTWTGVTTVRSASSYRPATLEVARTSRCFHPASLKSPNGWMNLGRRPRPLTEVTDPGQVSRARAVRTSPRSTISGAGGRSFSGLGYFKHLELPAFACLWPGWVCRIQIFRR
mmetsp:Transcript_117631/g.279289  ORF Transcript_117631/g.279289 Transcript_117631/m.279289 type:complete len:213 (-) Transcript_117631:418-1056(-)